jgi:hypothetical protein
LPLVVGAWGYTLTLILAPDHAGKEFYVACAEVIPVLLLALALEARVLSFGLGRYEAVYEARRQEARGIFDEIRDIEEEIARSHMPATEVQQAQKRLDGLSQRVNALQDLATASRRRWRVMRAVYVTSAALILLAGEIHALTVLAEENFKEAAAWVPMGAVVFAFVTIISVALLRGDE